jgi:branched-chain amino acid transport system substrate-binding protein
VVLSALTSGAGCGDDSSDSADDSATTAEAADQSGTTAPQPTGEPIVLAMANMEGSPGGSFPDSRLGAEAAVSYVNEELGGVHGRPLQLETCITRGSPETSASCANELVAKNPAAFVGGADFFAFASLPIYGDSGIPMVGGPVFTDAEMTATNTFRFVGSAASLGAMAIYAVEELEAETIALVYPDNIAGNTTVDSFIAPVVEAAGAEVARTPFAPDTPDFAPTLTNAVAADPDAIIGVVPPQACPGVLAAYRSVTPDLPFFVTTVCVEASVVDAVGEDAVEGIYTNSSFDTQGGTDEADAFRHAVSTSVDRESLDEIGVATFSTVMNLYAILTELEPENVTPEAIAESLTSSVDEPSFLGNTYTCDGAQVAGRPALCDNHTRVIRMGPDLEREYVTDWVDDHSSSIPPPHG